MRQLHPFAGVALQMRVDELGAEALAFERLDDLPLVIGAERLDGDAQLHGGLAVRGDELVVVQADDVALVVSDDLRHAHQLAGSVGQKHRNGEDAVALDQAVLHHRGHGDDVHVAAGEDGDDLLALEVQMAKSGHG